MKLETKEKLLEEYRGLSFPKETTAIKYWYQYNLVNVNIFFDAFDKDNPNLAMVLAYDNSYYYTSLNIKNTSITKEYLAKIPANILEQILDENNMLNSFFNNIEEHIISKRARWINYSNNEIFSRTLRNTLRDSKGRKDLPFLSGIKRVPMSNEMFNTLTQTMGIDKMILEKIQSSGITMVRTSDPTRRKKLTIILDGIVEI
jgi:hypothetical protein